MKTLALLLSASAIVAGTANASDLRDYALENFQPIPSTVPNFIYNPTSPEQVHLGQMLFFEPRLSASGIFSCHSCHNLSVGGDDNQEVSTGHGWQMGPRNSPTVLNAVFNGSQFWDGREPDLKSQAKGPIQAGVEMANTPEVVVKTLNSMPEYVQRFEAAFGQGEDSVSFDNMARALESFQATLITPAPFDAFLNGDDLALNAIEKAGLEVFLDKGCASCHNGVNVGGSGFHVFGVFEKPSEDILPVADTGRYAVTGDEADKYAFRTSTLRNITLTAPYFHSGKVWDLKDAVHIMSTTMLGQTLSETEADQIVAFLGSLEGVLPAIATTLPLLPPETATTPRPDLRIHD